MAKTLYDKIWDAHLVDAPPGETPVLYIDRHLVHEVTSPQAFEGLRMTGRKVRRPELALAVADHNVPTRDRAKGIADAESREQIQTLENNAREFGIEYFAMDDIRQGIVHIIGPEQGWTLPGQTIVCGDSHTSTHGAFGSLAFGIGTSEAEHVLATQTLPQQRPMTMEVVVDGELPAGVTPKDVVLAVIGRIGTGGGMGYVIEYRGSVFEQMSMEGRMTVCNMSIEAGARAGMIAPDETTFAYLKGRPHAPSGADWDTAVQDWKSLITDPGATFDKSVTIDATTLEPHVTWGTNPGQVSPISATVPDPTTLPDAASQEAAARALTYMGLVAGTPIRGITVDTVFIGSCTNSRIEDLRAAAAVLNGRHVHTKLRVLVVPGSGLVKEAAEAEGLDKVFTAAGAEWRD